MPFERYRRGQARTTASPTLTVQRGGVISFNQAAHELLGEPKAVELLYDPEREIIGLESSDLGAGNAYPVRAGTGKNSMVYMVSGAGFTKFYGIDTDAARRYTAFLTEGGMLCADLNSPPLHVGKTKTRTRSKKLPNWVAPGDDLGEEPF